MTDTRNLVERLQSGALQKVLERAGERATHSYPDCECEVCEAQADVNIVIAALSAQAARIPPHEPTEEMIEAGKRGYGATDTWKLMYDRWLSDQPAAVGQDNNDAGGEIAARQCAQASPTVPLVGDGSGSKGEAGKGQIPLGRCESDPASPITMRTIATFPISDSRNMDAHNMQLLARAALAANPQEGK